MKLRDYLKKNGHTAVWFADKVGMNPSYLSVCMKGTRNLSDTYKKLIFQMTNGEVTEKDWEFDIKTSKGNQEKNDIAN